MSALSRRTAILLAGALPFAPALALADAEPADPEHDHGAHAQQEAAGEDMTTYVPGASRLEGRIMAPCCWMQTIDIHGSPIAEELRSEIRRRLRGGESADAIEASFVQRFGPKILAVPNSSPLGGVATGLAVAFGGAGVAGYFMLKRWTRAGKKPQKSDKAPVAEPKRDSLDERLDRELSEIRDQA